MLVADQVQALEGLVDEVEHMAAIGEGAFRPGRDHEAGQRGCRNSRPDRGEHGALGRLPVANRGPALEPAFEDGKLGAARESGALPARRLSVAIRRDAAHAMEQGEIDLLLAQQGKDVAESRQDGQARAPAVTVGSAEQRRLTHDINSRHAGRELPVHGLGDDQAEIVGQTVLKPASPMRGRISFVEARSDPNFASPTHLDWAGRHVVGPEIEGATACEIKPGMVPVTGQDAVLDASAVEGEAHVRAAVVQGEDAVVVMHDEHWAMSTVQEQSPLGLQFGDRAGAHEMRA